MIVLMNENDSYYNLSLNKREGLGIFKLFIKAIKTLNKDNLMIKIIDVFEFKKLSNDR
jgi:hypothetical protein